MLRRHTAVVRERAVPSTVIATANQARAQPHSTTYTQYDSDSKSNRVRKGVLIKS